jgi:hypothetical protein
VRVRNQDEESDKEISRLIGWILYEQSGIREAKRPKIIMDKIRGVR